MRGGIDLFGVRGPKRGVGAPGSGGGGGVGSRRGKKLQTDEERREASRWVDDGEWRRLEN